MYRQILIHPDDRKYQRILWRNSSNDCISIFNLNTVTYGVGPSAFQALRCLRQLAQEASQSAACRVIEDNMYVDDCLFGHDTVDEAINVSRELSNLLMAGGFSLRKWVANDDELLKHIPVDWLADSSSSNHCLNYDCQLLGLNWNHNSDELSFHGEFQSQSNHLTKRKVL